MDSKQTKDYLVKELGKLIEHDYILLDLPYFLNVGDLLIWESTLNVLEQIPHRCLYQASMDTYKRIDIPQDVVILLMGGGNYGDLWYRHQLFRYRVMDDYPNNPIVQLPQSICFNDREKLDYDVSRVLGHKGGFTFCLREKRSFDIVADNYKGVKGVLLPDMVLSFDIAKYCSKHNVVFRQALCSTQPLWVQRTDCEKVDPYCEIPTNAVVEDWPTMAQIPFPYRLYKSVRSMFDRLGLCFNVRRKLTDLFFQKYFKDYCIRRGIAFVSPYRQVYSTRLHAAILAYLLGKQTFVIDNSYRKCSGVVNLWLDDQPNVIML